MLTTNEQQRELLSDGHQSHKETDEMAKNLGKDIDLRMRAIKNMLVIIGTIAVTVTYTSLYSLVLMVATPDDSCLVVDNEWLTSINTMLERHIAYVVWTCPVLYLFWPAEAHCHCRKRRKYHTSIATNS